MPAHFGWPKSLDLKPGDWVEVRSRKQIFATLSGSGRLDGMPFMPEMLQYCGKRFRVDSRAVVACDTAAWSQSGRWLREAVHLEGVRCDGSAHGGCQALCLIFWREAWLKRVSGPGPNPKPPTEDSGGLSSGRAGRDALDGGSLDEDDLHRLTTRPRLLGATLYQCQATDLRYFSFGQKRYDVRLLVRVLRSGNVVWTTVISVLSWALGNKLRRRLGLRPLPRIDGKCDGPTPSDRIDGLRPGDWVEIKSKEEIEATLGRDQKNRGLWFDVEMIPFCGRKMRLLRQVDRIIEERTGAMMKLPNDCWIIDQAVCSGYRSRRRLFCTRKIHSFWREIWFRRTDPPPEGVESSLEATLPVVQR